jgi:hypothetical protein
MGEIKVWKRSPHPQSLSRREKEVRHFISRHLCSLLPWGNAVNLRIFVIKWNAFGYSGTSDDTY